MEQLEFREHLGSFSQLAVILQLYISKEAWCGQSCQPHMVWTQG